MKKILAIIGLVLLFASAQAQNLTAISPFSIDTHDTANGWVIGGTVTDQTDALRYDYVTDPGEVLRWKYNGVLSPLSTSALDIEQIISRNPDGTFPTFELFVETPVPVQKPKHHPVFQLHRRRN